MLGKLGELRSQYQGCRQIEIGRFSDQYVGVKTKLTKKQYIFTNEGCQPEVPAMY